mmetsp:Transcript_27732/g.31695  ORF Transcript_27732/g.31695 Transcript_27732/m.31695 type:complete len:651 (-) Transcript_27732:152-2104(-)|eukprot:CAMPEP_0194130918 /NCGR_PEP_ID=MMETSP0152-20130528/1818_1 /TAXON_ID=1049557 /ORGANISM="Thalassiothrix antarctica, Strain L6-D1" /LENGTH=650 /DNA_ID=CAMNT_0038825555 /DNA_START=183 /DNA_END=2135 /DNA_ORIENTATION=+
MSRHRNVRNLTEDDYYDDYDDYDDYYEDEEDFNDSYNPSKSLSTLANLKEFSSDGKVKNKLLSMNNNVEKNCRSEVIIGFERGQAKTVLEDKSYHVQAAANQLLDGSTTSSTKDSIRQRKSFDDKRKSHVSEIQDDTFPLLPNEKRRGGISKPPAGFAPPLSGANFSGNLSSTNISGKEMFLSNKTSIKKKIHQHSKKDYGCHPNLPDYLKEEILKQKTRLTLVVLGHVDAGKSTLMGQLLVQLGNVPKRTIIKYQKQAAELGKASFALAWVMDEDDTERERGVTMDVATKYISTSQHEFVVLDAPGHADFVPSMITGAAAADVGILVVAATVGEFEAGFDKGGQTREHIILARGLGVSQLIVAVNKLDSVAWNQHRFYEIQHKIKPFLLQNGFISKRIKFVPISGLTGANVRAKEGTENLYKWYEGSTLLESMNNFQSAQRNVDKPLRIVVNDVYTEWNKGVTIRCRVIQGIVQVGEKIVILPVGDEATVSKIDHGLKTSGNRLKYATAGDLTEIVLLGVDIARVSIGNIISHPHWDLRPQLKRKVRAKIMVMDQLSIPIIRGAQVLLHMHSIDIPTILSKLLSSTNPKKKDSLKEKPRVLTSGISATIEMTFMEEITVEPYSDCRALGRFVLRRGGDTVAVGIIESLL